MKEMKKKSIFSEIFSNFAIPAPQAKRGIKSKK